MLPPYHSPNLNTAPPKATVAPSKPATAPPKPKPKPKPAAKPPVVYDGPKVDYDMLMLALSDEYIEAAYKLGPTIATSGDDTPSETLETYHNHIAAGLSCLEATLKVRSIRSHCSGTSVNELLEFQTCPENGGCYNIKICIFNVRRDGKL
jgi:hypothetical protein